jgi:flagellar basal-body rod protein FlgB
MEITTPTSAALERYLSLTSTQLRLTASNMANLDTPGYTTQGFDFQQEFAREMQSTAPAAGFASADPRTYAVDGLVARPDGNNVSLDREGLQLAKSQMQFKLGVQLIKSEFSMISSAIHASDGK